MYSDPGTACVGCCDVPTGYKKESCVQAFSRVPILFVKAFLRDAYPLFRLLYRVPILFCQGFFTGKRRGKMGYKKGSCVQAFLKVPILFVRAC